MEFGRGSSHALSVPVFGREDILEEVDRMVAEALAGHGQGLLLTGATGMGKSQVLRAVVDRHRNGKLLVLSGRALPKELPTPFSLIRDLLRSVSGRESVLLGNAVRSSPLSVFLAAVGGTESADSADAHPTPELAVLLDDLERIWAPVESDTIDGLGAGKDEMLSRVDQSISSYARDRPILVAIDDLAFADSSSLELLERMAAHLNEVPLLVVGTLGEGAEIPERTRPFLERLVRSPSFRSRNLPPLTVPEVTQLVRWILGGRTPTSEEVLRWHAETEGNPLFVEQLVRTTMGFGSPSGYISGPEGRDITEVLFDRVEGLGEVDRRVLTYAAVLGRELEFPVLLAVVGISEERLTESLDRLVQDGLLREKGNEVYEFVTEAVRAEVYADLTETRRRILHRKAGLALEAKGGVDSSELARQFYLGRDDDRAVRYNIDAAESATRAFAFETAVAHIARALEAERRRPGRDVRTEVRLLTEEGRLLTEMGFPHRSETVLTEAVELARSSPDRGLGLGRALLGLAQSRYLRGEYPSAETLTAEAWVYLPKTGTPKDLMTAHRVTGLIDWRLGHRAEAEAHQRAMLEVVEREGTPLEMGQALVDVANSQPTDLPGIERAIELYTRAISIFAQEEQHGARARALMNRAVTEGGVGRYGEALSDFALATEAAERAHSPLWIGYCQFNLAQVLAEMGRVEPARQALERAVRVLAPMGDRYAEQQIAMARGKLARAERAFADSEAYLQQSLVLTRQLRLPSEASEVLFELALLSHDRGDNPEATRRVGEARTAGLLEHRPDFAPRFAALERALGLPPHAPKNAPGRGGMAESAGSVEGS